MQHSDNAMKSTIHQAAGTLHDGIDKTATMARDAAYRVDAALGQARTGLAQAQAASLTVANAVGVAGRTALDGVKEINSTLAAHGKAALEDMVAVGQKSLAAKSLTDLVAVQTEYATRRLHAGFEAAGAINSLAHANTVALWSPIAEALRSSTVAASEPVAEAAPKAAKTRGSRKA